MPQMDLTRREFTKNTALLGAAIGTGLAFIRPAETRAECIRPPGALPEDEFLSKCIRCGQCGDACPNRCITQLSEETGKTFSISPGTGDEGTPVIFPRQQACNLCNSDRQGDALLCTDACPTGALRLVKKDPDDLQRKVQMGVAEVDTNLCYSYNGSSCGVCVRACPFERKALKAGLMERPMLDPDYCIGCGLCERSCIRYPQAITVKPVERM
ncbi:MAG: 4Fe-4S dicluster domain-containing protein [Planctomycetota bacterium]|jgi:MauM/NapG family ferredoxin protein|nr:4Fe-4S dicluster domain-containing protein [Planctomycetota bacterium]